MLRPLVSLACLGILPLRRSRLSPAQRQAAIRWVAHTAPSWGRTRVATAIGTAFALVAGLALGTAAAVPIYQRAHAALWDQRFETLTDLWDDLIGGYLNAYWGAIALHTLLVIAIALIASLLWLRLGARAALLRRGRCGAGRGCRHDLTGLPIEPDTQLTDLHTVRCTECGRTNPVFAPWGELANSASHAPDTRPVFAPAAGLVRVFWTAPRARLAAKLAAAVVAVSLLAWGGSWGWTYIDAHRQSSAAKAARLTPEEITRRINALRPPKPPATASSDAPPTTESHLDIARRVADRSRAITDAYNARHGLSGLDGPNRQAWLDSASSIRPLEGDGAQRAALHATALLEELRADGLEVLLDTAPAAEIPPPFEFVPEDTGGAGTIAPMHLSDVRQASRTDRALLRRAVEMRDLPAFKRRVETTVALYELSSSGPLLINALVADSALRELSLHLDWAARNPPAVTHASDWYDAIDRALAAVRPPERVVAFESERLFCLDRLASHFADPARIRRGLADPSITDAFDFSNINSFLNDGAPQGPTPRLGSFGENQDAMNAALDRLVAEASTQVWRPGRYDASAFTQSPLHFVRQLGFLPTSLRGIDTADLILRSVRITARIERFRALHGRPPTLEELPAAVGPGIDLTDPFTGKPLLYRTTNLPPTPTRSRWPARDYLLYSTGIDGIDHGGRIPPRQPDLPARNPEGEHDLALPDALLSP